MLKDPKGGLSQGRTERELGVVMGGTAHDSQ